MALGWVRARKSALGTLKMWPGRRTRRTCVELVVELVVFYVVLVELVETKDLIQKSLSN